jgi:hypothetical protein
MWIYRSKLKCKGCGQVGGLFYAYKNKGPKEHLKNRIYIRHLCKICFREEANIIDRKYAKRNMDKIKDKAKRWEEDNRAYRNKYKRKLYLIKRISLFAKYGVQY